MLEKKGLNSLATVAGMGTGLHVERGRPGDGEVLALYRVFMDSAMYVIDRGGVGWGRGGRQRVRDL